LNASSDFLQLSHCGTVVTLFMILALQRRDA